MSRDWKLAGFGMRMSCANEMKMNFLSFSDKFI